MSDTTIHDDWGILHLGSCNGRREGVMNLANIIGK